MRFYSEILATVSLFLLQSSTASGTPRLIPRLESLNKAYNKAPVTTKPGAGEGVRSWSNAYAAPTSRPAAAGLASAAGALHGTSRPVSTAAILGDSQSLPQPTGGPSLNSNFTAGQGEDRLRCPNGGQWQVWYDDFKTLDPAHWKTEESAKSFMSHDADGLTMSISQAMVCGQNEFLFVCC